MSTPLWRLHPLTDWEGPQFIGQRQRGTCSLLGENFPIAGEIAEHLLKFWPLIHSWEFTCRISSSANKKWCTHSGRMPRKSSPALPLTCSTPGSGGLTALHRKQGLSRDKRKLPGPGHEELIRRPFGDREKCRQGEGQSEM